MTIYFAYHYLEDLDKIRMNFLLLIFFFFCNATLKHTRFYSKYFVILLIIINCKEFSHFHIMTYIFFALNLFKTINIASFL